MVRSGFRTGSVPALTVILIVLLGVSAVHAQCADFVQQALGLMAQNCQGIARDNACYGYNGVDASFNVAVASEFFTQPADLAQIDQLSSLATQPYDPASGVWGIAVLKAQASLPDSLPGQAVTMVLLGDVNLQNVSDGMQSFVVSTGVGQPNCSQIPPSSLTVQGPRNVQVNLNINGANFTIGSTVTFRATENGSFRVSTLDGRAELGEMVIPAGFSRTAMLDEDGLIIEESWSEEEIIGEDELTVLETLEDLPDDVFDYEIDVPDEETLDLLETLDFDVIAGFDPYLLDVLLDDFISTGVTPDDLDGITLDDLGAYLDENLGYFDVDEAFLAALSDTFGYSDDEVAALAEDYGLDLDLIRAIENDDYDAIFADEDDVSADETSTDESSDEGIDAAEEAQDEEPADIADEEV